MPQTNHELLTIRLETTAESADATAVAATMKAMVTLIQEAERELEFPYPLAIRARPFASGSFLSPLELFNVSGLAILVGSILPTISDVLGLVKQFFEVRTLLKGKSPEISPGAEGSVTLSGDGNTFVLNNSVVNIVTHPEVNRVIAEAAKAVQEDKQISALELLVGENGQEVLTRVTREELPYLQSPPPTLAPNARPQTRTRTVRRVRLPIRKPVLYDSPSRWEFVYREHPIQADIADEAWLKNVVRPGSSERFGAGDRLVVDLLIFEEWNELAKAWEAKRYTVTKVHKHEEDGQLKLAFAKETKRSPKKANVEPETNGKTPSKKKPPKKRSPSKPAKRKKQ